MTRSPTPCPRSIVEWAGWAADSATIVARAADHAWTIDGSDPGAKAVAADAAYEGKFRLAATADTRSLWIGRYDETRGRWPASAPSPSPVTEVWQDTINTEQWAATGAFFDQNLTSAVIRRGNGPIYQGLVAVEGERGKARLLLAPENPDGQTGRFKGCCTVLGWADARPCCSSRSAATGAGSWPGRRPPARCSRSPGSPRGRPDDPATPVALNVGCGTDRPEPP